MLFFSVLWTLLLNAPLGLGSYWVARHGFRQPPGLPRCLAAVVLAWAWATLGIEVLGSLGWMSRTPVALLSISLMCFGYALRTLDRRREVAAEGVTGGRPWQGEAVVALGLILWAVASLALPSLLGPVKVVSDGPIYHLYFAARWWKEGRMFLVASPFGENAATYFPAVGDVWFAWLITAWGGDRLAKVGQAPFFLVCSLTSYALARLVGASRSSSLIATAWFVTSTPFLLFSFEPNVDTIFVAGYLLSAYFFLRFILGDGGAGSVALAALAAGGAMGTKATGIVFVPISLVLSILASFRRAGPWSRRVLLVTLTLTLPGVVAGYGFGRNAFLTGNPLYPLHVEAWGRVWLPGWYGSEVMRLSGYFIPRHHWRAFVDTLLAVLDPRMAPVWAFAIAGGWTIGRARPAHARWVWAFSFLAVLNGALYWLVIPYRTQQRFMLHALGLAVVPLAMTFERARFIRLGAVVLLAFHLFTAQGWPFAPTGVDPPWDLVADIPNAIPPPVESPWTPDRRGGEDSRGEARGLNLKALVLGLAAFGVAWARTVQTSSSRRTIPTVATTAVLGIIAVGVSAPRDVDPRLLFYPKFGDYIAGWIQLDLRCGPSGARVAYAGTNLPYYLLGVGLRNEVRYVNVDEHRDWLLHDYHQSSRFRGSPTWPHPRPGWDRVRPSYEAWLDNLRAEKVQMLVVARANPAEGPHNIIDSTWFPIERQWAESHPESFEALYGVAENDPRFRLYRVRTRPPRDSESLPVVRGVPRR